MVSEGRGRERESGEDTSLRKWVVVAIDFLKKSSHESLVVFKINPRDGSEIHGQLVLSEDRASVCVKIDNVVRAIDQKDRMDFHLAQGSIFALERYSKEKELESADTKVLGFDTKTPVENLAIERERKLREFGLERVKLRAYPQAEKVLATIMLDKHNRAYYDIRTSLGVANFFQDWRRLVSLLPPGVPSEELFKTLYPGQIFPEVEKNGYVWYLQNLAEGKIVSNTSDLPYQKYGYQTHFGETEEVFVMNWSEISPTEKDANGESKLNSDLYSSKVLEKLGIQAKGVVKISRNAVDQALWQGQPAKRIKTKKHEELVRYVGFDPNEWEFSCIRQDQYARMAADMGLGKQILVTHMDGYVLKEDPFISTDGLCGGRVDKGGVSHVVGADRNSATGGLAVRLVLGKIRRNTRVN